MSDKLLKAEQKGADSQSTAQRKLQEILGLAQCAVTFEPLCQKDPKTQPVVISCGHTFSVGGLEGVDACPACRRAVDGKPSNYMLVDILQQLAELGPILQAETDRLQKYSSDLRQDLDTTKAELKKERQNKTERG